MKKPIAICGTGPTRKDVPLDGSMEIWALAWDQELCRHASLAFEIHPRHEWPMYLPRSNAAPKHRELYLDHLRSLKCPVLVQRGDRDIPNSRAYPVEQVIAYAKRDLYACSACYQLAWAWYQMSPTSPRQVHLYGVECTAREYFHQRDKISYWLGRLDQVCDDPVVVHQSPAGALLRCDLEPAVNGKRYKRYGWIEA